jgi:Lsr2
MASIVSVIVNDDIDGSEGAETLTFGLDGMTYEIDLSEKNRSKLEKALAPYVSAGRRISRSYSRSNASRAVGPRVDRALIRAWAKEQGFTLSERGRISAEVMRRYEAAH